MKLIKLIIMQFKLNLKNMKLLGMLFLMPIVILFLMNVVLANDDSSNLNALVYTNSNNQTLVEKIFENETINIKITDNLETALEDLKDNKVDAVYEIDGNLETLINNNQENIIKMYILQENYSLTTINDNVSKIIKEIQKENFLNNHNINEDILTNTLITYEITGNESFLDQFNMSAIMIVYFMFLSSSEVAKYLQKLKQNKVLKRLLTTDNSNLEIISTFALSFFFLQVILTTAALLIFHLMFPMEIVELVSTIISISLMSLVSLAISILGIRLFKREEMLTSFMTLVTVVLFALGLMGVLAEIFELPVILIHLSKLSPFYWAMDIVNNQNYFINSIVILLMGGIVLTAGSINLKQFTD